MRNLICMLLIGICLTGCITHRCEFDIDQAIAITQLSITTAENSLQLYIQFQEVKEEEIQRRLDHIQTLREQLQILLKRGNVEVDLPNPN